MTQTPKMISQHQKTGICVPNSPPPTWQLTATCCHGYTVSPSEAGYRLLHVFHAPAL